MHLSALLFSKNYFWNCRTFYVLWSYSLPQELCLQEEGDGGHEPEGEGEVEGHGEAELESDGELQDVDHDQGESGGEREQSSQEVDIGDQREESGEKDSESDEKAEYGQRVVTSRRRDAIHSGSERSEENNYADNEDEEVNQARTLRYVV